MKEKTKTVVQTPSVILIAAGTVALGKEQYEVGAALIIAGALLQWMKYRIRGD